MEKINLGGANHAEQARIQRSNETERTAETEQPAAAGGASPAAEPDKVAVSDRASTVARLVSRAAEMPEVRQERVEALRKLVESGDYNPSADSIADAILKNE